MIEFIISIIKELFNAFIGWLWSQIDDNSSKVKAKSKQRSGNPRHTTYFENLTRRNNSFETRRRTIIKKAKEIYIATKCEINVEITYHGEQYCYNSNDSEDTDTSDETDNDSDYSDN
ncbi:uncharacterized protein LOC134713814 [Mytilus trossulus]|uniref:uncharacterized protein LOC134713814 n=1 Tax=Mytilus trossulus TaxID=6551 RepID=UPI003006E7EE